ncbi:hypothetical protein N0V93_006171 [Gnomoniopsis smithogilvyi]|uniref:Uncharacterized protein n=1 Tax=Gnomoniopsis smithogilvyi TaxID=1191159 RepID=A0A9W8YP66_9PEZI|nr:hypothetical protein N0V93_006171 [Gnomoniopsis smithogilvyi]
MLALRLRGSRSIRTQFNGSSCRAHMVPATTAGCRRPKAFVRTYAVEVNKSNDNGPKSSKSTKSKRQKGAKASDAESTSNVAKDTEPNAEDGTLDNESKAKTIKILKEATLLLRELQADPAKFAAKKNSDGTKSDDSKRSLKSQFTPIKGAPKFDERQTKIFHETLTVLGDALKIVARSSSDKDKILGADILAARDAIAAFSSGHTRATGSGKSEEKTGDTTPKQSQAKDLEPDLDGKPQERPKKRGESQQKPAPQDSPKKKGQSQQKSEKKETDEPRTKKTKGKKVTQPVTSEAVSQSVATVVASARSASKAQKTTSKSASKRKGDTRSSSAQEEKQSPKIENFRAESASALKPIKVDMKPVPLIQYGLDRVLFKDGVYPLQDPRTRVWNFDPYLATIMPVNEFDFDALTEYVTSSKDQKLIGVTKREKKKYTGSTSSMTSTLAHFHFLLSKWRPINCARLSKQFDIDVEGFSGIMKAPAATILNYKDGVYAIDADKEWDNETVLSMLGKSMEKLLTVPKEEFVKYHRSKSHELTEEEKGQEESYHYTTYGDFMMRSQLDAYDPRLPGTGVYDLKTRAVVSIRMDAVNVEKGAGYEIRQRDGNWESFEREYFDMIRSAFLKYSLQVRMGRMDGIFVAYHNTERIFGFQYIPLEEMDLSIHGTTDTTLGDKEFTASLKLFNELLNQATAKFPKQSLRIHVETRPSKEVPFLYFFAEPVNDEQIKNIQEKSKGNAEKFKAKFGLPLGGKESMGPESNSEELADVEGSIEVEEMSTETDTKAVTADENSDQVWQDMMDVVEDTMDKDAEGITAIREAIQQALEQSGLLHAKSSEEAQHYIEALLKSIVDPEAELAKSESHIEEDEEVVQQSNKPETPDSNPEPKRSSIGSIFSWFRPSAREPETPAEPTAQEEVSPEDETISKKSSEEADTGPSPELVELLVKLTSRVGTTSTSKIANAEAKQQELSDDQARLRSFETILLEMMPEVLDSPEEKAEEKGTAPVESGDSATGAKPQGSEAEKDSIFAMYVTIRNKVNNEPVERPENLRSEDKWNIEYAMEELHGERAAKLYRACMKRRQTIHIPRERNFKSMFDGALPEYIEAGRLFRKREKKIAQRQPVWIVGQPAPLRASEVFNGAGAKLVHVLPSMGPARRGLERKKEESQDLRTPTEQKSTGDTKEERADQSSIEEAVLELRKNEEGKASSFKEWREKSKQ